MKKKDENNEEYIRMAEIEEVIMRLYSYIRIADVYIDYYDESEELLHLGYLIYAMQEIINPIMPYYCSLYNEK